MLTGGRSAKALYEQWNNFGEPLTGMSGVHFFIGDERCVSTNHPDSNYGMVMRTLLPNGKPKFVEFDRMEAESINVEDSADRYAALLPDSIDVLLLSMGDDGHIASLFPNSPALFETKRKVLPVISPFKPYKRLTITPPVIQAAKHVYVLAIGDKKRLKYEEALLEPEDINSLPARLVLDRIWIFNLNE